MVENYGVRFSEDNYLTKEEIADAMNICNVDFVWNDVINYRKLFARSLELPSIDCTKFSLTFTKGLSSKLMLIERNLNKCYFKYSSLNSQEKNLFRTQRLVKILQTVAKSEGIQQTDTFLTSLISNTLSTIPNDSLILDNYYRCLSHIANSNYEEIKSSDINALYTILTQGSLEEFHPEDDIFRKETSESPHYYLPGYIYKEALVEKIPEMINSNCEFISQEEELASLRSISSLFYFDYISPYDGFRGEMSCLDFKLALACGGFGMFATFINIEQLYLFKDEQLDEIKKTVQKTLDLTFFVRFVLNFLEDDIRDLMQDLLSVTNIDNPETKEDIKTTSQLLNMQDLPSSNSSGDVIQQGINQAQESINHNVNTYSDLKPVQIYSDANVALPILPAGLQKQDVERITNDLLETYPSMKYSQAHFYASHCTIGRSYTIQQFKKEEGTSYETARTSMDYLSEMGFYQKNQLKNKFVYRPIPRRKNYEDE